MTATANDAHQERTESALGTFATKGIAMFKVNAPAAWRALMAGLCVVVGFAHAATVELYDGTFDVSTTLTNGTGNAASDGDSLGYTLNFAQFDASLGELTGVSITFQGNLETSFVVSRGNSGPNSAQQVTVALDRTAGFELAGGDALGSVLDAFSASYALAKNTSVSGAPSPFATLTVGGTWTATTADLAAFIGVGSFGLNAIADLTQTLTGPNGTSLLSSAHWWGGAALVYTYSPFATVPDPITEPQQAAVPEPSALLLAGAGLLAIAVLARRRSV